MAISFNSLFNKTKEAPVAPVQPTVPQGNSDYQVVNGVLKKYLGTDTEVNIPSNLNITSIGDRAFFRKNDIINVKMPVGITAIGNYAFSGCDNLKHITFSNSLATIGNYAFENCKSLEGVTLPDTLTSIGSYAFSGCKKLERASMPDSLKAIGNFLFNKCESLSDIDIPETVTSIGWSAFAGCSSLKKITLPEKCVTIGNNAFQGCAFTSLHIPSRINSIGEGAFFLCNSLESVTIDQMNNTYIVEDGILYNREKTLILLYPAKLNQDKKEYTVAETVTSIGYGAFSGCEHLKSITLPQSLVKIDGCAFFGCTSLSRMNIPDSVLTIGKSAFQRCTDMISITLPSKLSTIETGLLSGCENLVLADIPDSVVSIGYIAFFGCKSLSSLEIPDSVTTINKDAFSRCNSLKEVTIPKNVTLIDKGAFGHCAFLEAIHVDEANTEYSDKDGVLFNKAGNYLITYPAGKTDDKYSISEDVVLISDAAFMGANNLVTLNIPSSIQTIGTSAFSECVMLTDVYIAENVTSIGTFAFSKCSNLSFILLPNSIKSIENTAFAECSNLTIFCETSSYGYKYAMDNSIRWSSLAPEQVTEVSLVKSTHKTITLTWKAIPGKVEYDVFIYNQTSDKFELAGKTTTNEITFEYLNPGTIYTFKVAALRILSENKYMGSYSDEITVCTNPGKVTNLESSTNTINSIVLSWDTVKNANEYQVFIHNSQTDEYECLTTTKTNKVLLTGLTPGTNNQYKVMAISNFNSLKLNGPFSEVISTGTSIGQITGLKCISSTSNSLTIYWDEISDAYMYVVYQLNPANGQYEELEKTNRNTLTFEDLVPGTEFSFKVACIKMIDKKECVGTPCPELNVSTNLLPVTGVIMASHTPTSVKLNWLRVPGATGYEVVVYNPLSDTYEPAGTTEVNNIVFDDLTPGQTYKYKVMAIKEIGENKFTGNYSSVVIADTIC